MDFIQILKIQIHESKHIYIKKIKRKRKWKTNSLIHKILMWKWRDDQSIEKKSSLNIQNDGNK